MKLILIFPMVFSLFQIVPGIMFRKRANRNKDVSTGFKTSRSMQSQESWAYANRLSGTMFLLFGILDLLFALTTYLICAFTENFSLAIDLLAIQMVLFFLFTILAIAIPIVCLRKKFPDNQHS